MNRATWLKDRRVQKFRDVLSRWEAGELSMIAHRIAPGLIDGRYGRVTQRRSWRNSEFLQVFVKRGPLAPRGQGSPVPKSPGHCRGIKKPHQGVHGNQRPHR